MHIVELKHNCNLSSYSLFKRYQEVLLLDSPSFFCECAFEFDGTLCQLDYKGDKHINNETVLVLASDKTMLGLDVFAHVYQADMWTAVQKIRFVSMAYHDLGQRNLLQSLLPLLGLVDQDDVLNTCLQLGKLPNVMLDFCQNKQVSLKQLRHLKRFKAEFLAVFCESVLANYTVSFSVMLELCESLYDLYLREYVDFEQVMTHIQVDTGHIMPLNALRQQLKQLRNPLQIGSNKAIAEALGDDLKRSDVEIKWDETLEERFVSIKLRVEDEKELDLLDDLKKLKPGIKNALAVMEYDS